MSESRRNGLRGVGLLFIALAILGGCASPPKPTIIQTTIIATDKVNPNVNGRASPVIVRFYELKGRDSFDSADYFTLWDHEKETLGADLVNRDEYQLTPGSEKKFERTLGGDTKQLGVVASFRDLDHGQWRTALAVVPQKTSVITIKLDGITMSIAGKPQN